MKENDVVALLVDLPEQNLRRDDVGMVIEIFSETEHHPAGFMIEFVDDKGEVYQQADITEAAQIMRLNFHREAA